MILKALILMAATATSPYSTTFTGTENPISENSVWVNGAATGLDWTNMRKTPGIVFGTQAGSGSPPYDDSIACLNGTWGSNQVCIGTFNRATADNEGTEEIELLGRWSITAHTARGYEVNFGVVSGNSYTQIIQWNGALNNFTAIDSRTIGVIPNGCVCTALFSNTTASNLRVTVITNNVEIFHADINNPPWTNGAPGIGAYWIHTGSGAMSDYGWSAFTATDGTTNVVTYTNVINNGVLRSFVSQ